MKRLAILLLLLLPAAFAQQQWSIGYYTPWGNPGCPISDIDMGALTHVVHWAALVNADGSLDLNYQLISTDAPTMVATAHAAGVKAILGIVNPYWLGQSGNMSAATKNNRAGLVRNIMNVVNTYGYDGVDIDWEGGTLTTTSTDGANFRALASDLKTQLGSKPLMAAAVVTDSAYWGASHTSFDRVNIMTYDMSGTWDTYSWYNSALYDQDGMVWSVNLAVSRYTAAGTPASKLGIGIPFYGWQWTGVTGPKQTGATGASQIYYQNLASMISNPQWDSLAKVPWQGGTNTFLSFDNAQSIAEKVNYAKSKALGGWIIWELSGDYIPTANPKHPLLTAVKNAMGPASATTAPTITSSSPLSAGIVGVAYSQTLTASGTAPISWSITSGALPAGLTLNASTGVIGGTAASAGTATFTVQATNTAGYNQKQFSITVNAPPFITTSSPFPAGAVGTPYSQTLTSTGTAPITWSLTGGALPSGLSLNSAGTIAGTPSAAGTFSFTVQAANVAGSNSKQFSLTVNATVSSTTNPPSISSTSPMAAGTAGTTYSQTLAATGTAPFTWSVTAGTLPSGLSLDPASGSIAGTPVAAGTSSFTVQAANNAGTNSKQFSLTVNPGATPAPSGSSWSMATWTQWGNPAVPISDIDWAALTHVVHYAAVVNANGTLDLNTHKVAANAPALISAAHAAGVKVLLGVIQPYGQTATGNFYQAATNKRAVLVKNIAAALNTYGFDGVDINWQPFDVTANGPAMKSFASTLRTKLGSQLMTVESSITTYAYWATVQSSFDRINVMTYGMSGSWDPYSWHNSALFDGDGTVWSVDLAVKRFTGAGIPASKLNIGIAFFGMQNTGGQSSTNTNQGITGPNQIWAPGYPPNQNQVSYQSIAPMITSQNYHWDSVAQVPYLSIDNTGSASDVFLSYDNEQSVAAKVNYVKSNSLGGWSIWDLSSDYFPSQSPKHPLLTAMKNAR